MTIDRNINIDEGNYNERIEGDYFVVTNVNQGSEENPEKRLIGRWNVQHKSKKEQVDLIFHHDEVIIRICRDGKGLSKYIHYSIEKGFVKWKDEYEDGQFTSCTAKLPVDDNLIVEYINSWDGGRGSNIFKKDRTK